VSALLGRNFTGIDLYPENVDKAERNIKDAQKGKVAIKVGSAIVNIPMENNIPPLESYLGAE
jgi:DNA modification methylase